MWPRAVAGNRDVGLTKGRVALWPQPGTEAIVAPDDLKVTRAAGTPALGCAANGVTFWHAAKVGSDMFSNGLAEAFPLNMQNRPSGPRSTTLSVGVTCPKAEISFFATKGFANVGHLRDMSASEGLVTLDGLTLRGDAALPWGAFVTGALAAGHGDIFDWTDSVDWPDCVYWPDSVDIAVALDTGWSTQGWTKTVHPLQYFFAQQGLTA